MMSANIPALNSFPGAPKSLYLDFDGHFEDCGYEESTGFLDWCGSTPFGHETFEEVSTPAFRGGAADIREIWKQVAEDFAPFNINVTTVNPGNFSNGRGLRVAIGGSWEDWYGKPAGGVALLNNFNDDATNTVWVFDHNSTWNYSNTSVADTVSHEAGHAFGLEHQSLFVGGTMQNEYRPGDSQRGPLMGDSSGSLRSLWAAGPNKHGAHQDDLAVLARVLGYRADDHFDSLDWTKQALGTAGIVYDGVSPIAVMIPYKNGVLTAFSNVGGNSRLHRIHWSADARHPGSGPIVYEGISPVNAMVAYKGGVLTAFSNAAGNPNLHRVHWSSNGQNLGGGPVHYEGSSPVKAMTAYNGGVLTAFSKAGPKGNRIHWSANGQNLGGGPIYYDGHSPITAMIAHSGGVLSAFSNAGPGHRIHWSSNGKNLGGGPIRYEGCSPVTAMASVQGGVLTAFTNAECNRSRNRIHASLPTPLEIQSGQWQAKGVIETTGDRDVFGFTANAGMYRVTAGVANPGPNLDARIEIYDASGRLIAAQDDASSLSSSLNVYLESAPYRVMVRSHGAYGDVGQYLVTAVRTGAVPAVPGGDLNDDGSIGDADANLIALASVERRNIPELDPNSDREVNSLDARMCIEDLVERRTGDSNLDGIFDSSDLAMVLQHGLFEQDVDAIWSDGDWNGDGRFDTSDVVAAFQGGGYNQPRHG
jgi:hypothetical protein